MYRTAQTTSHLAGRDNTMMPNMTPRSKLFAALAFCVIFAFLLGSYSDIPKPHLPSLPLPSNIWSGLTSHHIETGPSAAAIGEALALQELEHPIDTLVLRAKEDFQNFERPTKGIDEAAAAYRERRGRHPPPGFDKWVKFAGALMNNPPSCWILLANTVTEGRNAVMMERFFDTMHDSIDAFWGVEPTVMREFPASWPFTISIRNGNATRWADESDQVCL